jgi:hypothetical protein
MISGKDNLIKWVQQSDCAYWKIFPHGSARNNFMAGSDENNSSMTQSLERLSQSLDLIGDGRYVICCKKTPDQTKGLLEMTFEHTNELNPGRKNPGVGTLTSSPAPANFYDLMEAKMDAKIEALENRHKMERMEEKIKSLESENALLKGNSFENAASNVIKKLDPYVDPVLEHFFPVEGKTKIAAVGFNDQKKSNQKTTDMSNTTTKFVRPTNPPTSDAEASERANAAVQAWANNDPKNFLAIVEKLAEMTSNEKDIATYNMYVPMLLK